MPGQATSPRAASRMLKARQRMTETLRILPGSSLVVAPSDADLAAPEIAAGLEESFGGGGYTALQRAALLQMAWDHVASALDGRESAFELHANGGIPAWRGRMRRYFGRYNELANGVLEVPEPRHAGDRSGEHPRHPDAGAPPGHSTRHRADAPGGPLTGIPRGLPSRQGWPPAGELHPGPAAGDRCSVRACPTQAYGLRARADMRRSLAPAVRRQVHATACLTRPATARTLRGPANQMATADSAQQPMAIQKASGVAAGGVVERAR